jgi:phosphoglycerate kinase
MTKRFRTLDDLDVAGKRVVVRVDLNVPVKDGKVADDDRIVRILPTLRELADKRATAILLSHFDRPKGKVVPEMSLGPLAQPLAKALGRFVTFVPTSWNDDLAESAVAEARPGDVILLENTRFHPGDEKNDPKFACKLASLGDVFLNDAFSVSHRAHASTEGIAHLLPSVAGRAMEAEISALEQALATPERPLLAVVGGAKVSSKLGLLGNLCQQVDGLIIGGGMANTFLAAQGKLVGQSMCEHHLADAARDIMGACSQTRCQIILPVDAVVAKELSEGVNRATVSVDEVGADDMILDIGPQSVSEFCNRLDEARTVVWNGPLGAFEVSPFDAGTSAVARHVATLTKAGRLTSIAGGGDTLAALRRADVLDQFSYVSAAGGAFLEWLEGKQLPGVVVLMNQVT